VRVLTVESCATICQLLPHNETEQLIMPTLREIAVDKSWRVRYMVADRFIDVSRIIHLLPLFSYIHCPIYV
jgi:serine/threonine-protein phosphatase 2A regulatory subunit A